MKNFPKYHYCVCFYEIKISNDNMSLTVFPHIVSAETILFLNLKIVGNSNSWQNFNFLPNKLKRADMGEVRCFSERLVNKVYLHCFRNKI